MVVHHSLIFVAQPQIGWSDLKKPSEPYLLPFQTRHSLTPNEMKNRWIPKLIKIAISDAGSIVQIY
jgi:hypothetical protein